MENRELELAHRLVETTGANLFLTGKAGTGKTTFLRNLRQDSSKRIVVLAPTGIAAINAGGMTIHSFFQLGFSPFIPGVGQAGDSRSHRWSRDKRKVIRTMDLLVIDEISMVRADLLDAVDAVLRRFRDPSLPFGGIQLLLIGDLGQLAPVVKDDEWALLSPHYSSPYFFDSHAIRDAGYETIHLNKVYRQQESQFLDILNLIRDNRADSDVLAALNRRCIPGYAPHPSEHVIRLVALNRQADAINAHCFGLLSGDPHTYEADIKGDFPEYNFPTDRSLSLKVNTQVMFVKNDTSGSHSFYNGLIGEVTGFSPSGNPIVNRADGSGEITVFPEVWENNKYTVNSEGKMQEECIGSFSQLPLRLAWAITIHKSQGLTFDRAIIDTSSSFAHGQTYVALSRCRTLEGLTLEAPVSARDIICDTRVVDYQRSHALCPPDEQRIASLRKVYVLSLIRDLFSFRTLSQLYDTLHRISEEYFRNLYPNLAENIYRKKIEIEKDICEVASKFAVQYNRLLAEAPAEIPITAPLNKRLQEASKYFCTQLRDVQMLIHKVPKELDNVKTQKRLQDNLSELREHLFLKCDLFNHIAEVGFDITSYLNKKTEIILSQEGKTPTATPKRAKKSKSASPDEATFQASSYQPTDVMPTQQSSESAPVDSTDILHHSQFAALRAWRKKKAAEQHVPLYMIAHTKTLIAIANNLPATLVELKSIKGVGSKFLQNYGSEILDILAQCLK